jgi:transposase
MPVVHRKPYPSDLTDAQWGCIDHLLPEPAQTGRRRCNAREVLNGVLYVLSTGCRWKDLPHDIAASPSTCHRWLLEFQRRRIWQKMQRELMKEADRKGKINLNNAYHDASVVKSKRGRSKKLDTPENIRSKGSNGISSSTVMGTRSISRSAARTTATSGIS